MAATGQQLRIVKNRNDVLTVLIHLGYLAYDGETQECYIPNKEVACRIEKQIGLSANP